AIAELEKELEGYEAKMIELGKKWSELAKKEKAQQAASGEQKEETPPKGESKPSQDPPTPAAPPHE
ncbi:MAG: hypothetical protein D6795_07240, partial [Deltaproteobacteria bacterium]